MIGNLLQYALLAIYVACALAFALDHNWPKCLYFAGAAILMAGVASMP